MKSIRIRTFGEDDWTYVRVEGEDEERTASVMLAAVLLDDPDRHVQVADEGEPWEDADG